MRVKVMPLVSDALRTVTKDLEKRLEEEKDLRKYRDHLDYSIFEIDRNI